MPRSRTRRPGRARPRATLAAAAVLALAAIGCAAAGRPAPAPPREPASAPAGAGAVAPPPGPREGSAATAIAPARVAELTRALLAAWDRGDADAADAALAPDFLKFEGGEIATREAGLARLRARKPGAPYIAARTWASEEVRVGEASAIFVGKAIEQQGGNVTKGGYKHEGWYLVEWVPRGGQWRARLWTWQRAGESSQRDRWNDIYRHGLGFSREPNRLLVDVARTLRPGAALDVAMGQGRNALHLAARGWRVTGVDFSDEGLRIARDEAARRGLTVTAINANLDEYDFGAERWDLITLIYAGDSARWLDQVERGLRRGGTVVVEYFAADGPGDGNGFEPGELARRFGARFEILRDEVVEAEPDWAMDRARLVRFVARKR